LLTNVGARSEYEYESNGSYIYESDDNNDDAQSDDGDGDRPSLPPEPSVVQSTPASPTLASLTSAEAVPTLAETYSATAGASDHREETRSRLAAVAQLYGRLGTDYRVLDPGAVVDELQATVGGVAGVLEISEEDAQALLIARGWDRSRVLEMYLEDPDKERRVAGVPLLPERPRPTAGEVDCPICYAPTPAEHVACLRCGHAACEGCWADYLTEQLSSTASAAVKTRCVQTGCSCIVTRALVNQLSLSSATDASLLLGMWDRSLARNFIESSRTMAWCPGQGCNRAFQALTPLRDVECDSCGTAFCFRCGHSAHRPVECSLLGQWLDKCNDESETANWMLVNTKKCPKCGVRIEKNQGCNHMKCKSCAYEFCWVCTGPWELHGQKTGGYYTCNRYDGQKAGASASSSSAKGKAAEDDPEAKAKAELDRYLFYFQRYSNHMRAGSFAARQRQTAQQRMGEVAGSGKSWSDIEFLETGAEVLIACRRVLQYTYVLAFYMTEGTERALLEHLQEMLEGSTEELSELLEQPMEKMDRPAVINYTRVTAKFLSQLLEGVDEGLTGGVVAAAPTVSASKPAELKPITNRTNGPTKGRHAVASTSSSVVKKRA
jgi:ariadne-1